MKLAKFEFELYDHGAEVFFMRDNLVQCGYIRQADITRYETWVCISYGIMYFDGEDNVDVTLNKVQVFATKQDLIDSL